ncbi:MAG: hypothetical protein ACRCYO_04770 [Bacteroidia bacterium]
MKNLLLLLLALFSLAHFSCTRKETTAKVTYIIRETSSSTPAIAVTYTSDQAGASTQISIPSDNWDSQTFELKAGQYVTMRAESSSQSYTIRMKVIVNGVVWGDKTFSNPATSAEISGNIPVD